METENTTASETQATVEPNNMVSASSALLNQVADAIKNSDKTVQDKFTSLLVDKEINARVDMLDKAFTQLKETQSNLKKCKPDQQSLDGSGKVVSETYTKAKFEERKKLMDQADLLEKMINKALSGDWSKIKEKCSK